MKRIRCSVSRRARFEVESLEARLVLSVTQAQLAAMPYVPDQVLVQYQPWATESTLASARGKVSSAGVEDATTPLARALGRGRLELITLPAGSSLAQSIARLEADPAVAFAEPNWIYQTDATSNDTYYTNGSLWGMYGDGTTPANQYGSQAGEAWASGNTGSSSVVVGVIDEGIMKTHEDLVGNIWVNPYDPVDGVDNDGNGYVDDINGWDFAGNNNSIYDGTADDHGTHVAGTIGATGGNGKGVAGVNWSITMISAKFLGNKGGTTANAVKAVDYITDLKTRHGMNIVATNNSWGGGGFSQALKNAIDRAGTQDILFVAAAGNSGLNIDATPQYPASYTSSNIIAVAALTSTGALASYSNYGATSVDIGAPGSGITSTVPLSRNRSGYASYSGTSMATPHVTGAAALYAAVNPGASAGTIKAAILGAGVPTSSLAGKTLTGDRLNVSGFVGSGKPAGAQAAASSTAAESSASLAATDFAITSALARPQAKKGLPQAVGKIA